MSAHKSKRSAISSIKLQSGSPFRKSIEAAELAHVGKVKK